MLAKLRRHHERARWVAILTGDLWAARYHTLITRLLWAFK